ncbi:hypothetical protein EDB89DRAFT_2083943 [Lactarius sanguifluus]|nr:hypothetical protein EDB89DRAFT_2083943 [Lactarius sanguifluus]
MWILTAKDAELPLKYLGKPMKLQPSPLKMRSPRFHFAPTAKDAAFPVFHLAPLLRLQFTDFHFALLLKMQSSIKLLPSTNPEQAKDASTLPADDAVPPSTNPGQAKDASILLHKKFPANKSSPHSARRADPLTT